MRILRIYDSHMRFMGEIDGYKSLVWTRRWQEPGEFSISTAAAPETVRLLSGGFFAWVRGEAECGLIERVAIEEDEDGPRIEAGGRFAEALFSRRRIRGQPYQYSGAAEEAFRTLIDACAPLFSKADGITMRFGAAPEGHTSVRFQATYRNLLSYLERLAKSLSVGFRLRPDFAARTMTFECRAPRDAAVTFSSRFDNLLGVAYEKETSEYANVCFVGGSGEGKDRIFVTAGDESLEGLARREALLEATEAKADGVTDKEYREQLVRAGEDALAQQYAEAVSAECDVDAVQPFQYGTDWDLGDTVILRRAEWGIDERMRVSEVSIVTEDGITQVKPVFGNPVPEKIEWEDSD